MYNLMGLIKVHVALTFFHCSVIMHSFPKKCFRFCHISPATCIHFKTLIGFALRVSRTKGYSFKSGTSFVELAVNGRN